jgi:hypothetical protein
MGPDIRVLADIDFKESLRGTGAPLNVNLQLRISRNTEPQKRPLPGEDGNYSAEAHFKI